MRCSLGPSIKIMMMKTVGTRVFNQIRGIWHQLQKQKVVDTMNMLGEQLRSRRSIFGYKTPVRTGVNNTGELHTNE